MTPGTSSLLGQVIENLRRHRERPFIFDPAGGLTLSYIDLHSAAAALAEAMRGQGLRRGDRVLLFLANGPEFVIAYFACLYVGLVAVPVNLHLHKRDVDFVIAHAGARLVLVRPQTAPQLDATLVQRQDLIELQVPTAAELVTVGRGLGSAAVPPTGGGWRPLDGATEDDLFSITFTSGTTGRPKGVCHRVGGLLGSAVAFNAGVGIGPDHRFYHVLPMAYMAGFLNTLLCPFMAGASVVIGRAFDTRLALAFWDTPIRHQINAFWLVPSILAMLLKVDRHPTAPEFCRQHVKTICVGTAPLPLKLKHEFETRYGVTLLESYGLSETLFVSTNGPAHVQHPGAVGRLLAGVECQVISDEGRELPPGQDGDIWIRSPFMMAGYLDPETQVPIPQSEGDWFPSGDIGHFGSDGNLFITGRKKDLIIRGGVNISPRAVEEVLLQHPAVEQVAVVGLPHELYGEEVVAALVLQPEQTLPRLQVSLADWCRAALSPEAIPSRFFALEQFPVNATGKVQKGILRDRLLASLGTAGEGG